MSEHGQGGGLGGLLYVVAFIATTLIWAAVAKVWSEWKGGGDGG